MRRYLLFAPTVLLTLLLASPSYAGYIVTTNDASRMGSMSKEERETYIKAVSDALKNKLTTRDKEALYKARQKGQDEYDKAVDALRRKHKITTPLPKIPPKTQQPNQPQPESTTTPEATNEQDDATVSEPEETDTDDEQDSSDENTEGNEEDGSDEEQPPATGPTLEELQELEQLGSAQGMPNQSLLAGMTIDDWWNRHGVKFLPLTLQYERVTHTGAHPAQAENPLAKYVLPEDDLKKQLPRFTAENLQEAFLYRLMVELYYQKLSEIETDNMLRLCYEAAAQALIKHLPVTGSNKPNAAKYCPLVENVLASKLDPAVAKKVATKWEDADTAARSAVLQRRSLVKGVLELQKQQKKAESQLSFSQKSILAEALIYLKFMDERNNAYLEGGEFYPSKKTMEEITALRAKTLDLLHDIGPAIIPFLEEALLEVQLDYWSPLASMDSDCLAVKYYILSPVSPHRLFVHETYAKELQDLVSRLRSDYKLRK